MANLPVQGLNLGLGSNTELDENTFWNYVIIGVIVVVVIYLVFFKNKEGFAGLFSLNPLPNLSKISKDVNTEKPNRSEKIIQKINQIDKALGDNIGAQPNQSTQPNQPNDQTVQAQQTQLAQLAQNLTANGSVGLMNQIGLIDGEPVACNMLGVNSANMDEYKKKFYSMYSHQIECPAKCKLNSSGMSKGCGMGSKCGMGKDCAGINSDTSIPDTFALNYLALDNANKKPCVTCNYKPRTTNPLNREWMERDYPSYDGLPEDVKMADDARLKKMGLIDANVSNYVNFENNVYQDSVGESAPDKINEIRTCVDANGTCSLKDYGTSIANAYDKLTANPAYTSRNNCNPYQLTGVFEDASSTDLYARVQM